jgi:hypothetical protein
MTMTLTFLLWGGGVGVLPNPRYFLVLRFKRETAHYRNDYKRNVTRKEHQLLRIVCLPQHHESYMLNF